jgi:hypothetical protein
MKAATHPGKCIACAGTRVQSARIMFMAKELEYSICRACAHFVERVVSEESFAPDYLRFLGVAGVNRAHRRGGAFSGVVPQQAAPDDLTARVSDFDTFCEFFGQRIRALRSHETPD